MSNRRAILKRLGLRVALSIALGALVAGVSLWAHDIVWIRGWSDGLTARLASLLSTPGSVIFGISDILLGGRLHPHHLHHAIWVHGLTGIGIAVGAFAMLTVRRWLSTWNVPPESAERTDLERSRVHRRRLIIDGAGAAVATPAVGAWVYGACVQPWDLRVRRVTVAIDDLPSELEGLRIGHLSDPHVGPRVPPQLVRRAVDALMSERLDLVALTGDYVDRRLEEAVQAAELLAPLCERAPVVATLGNHDWYAGGWRVRDILQARGMVFLENAQLRFDRHAGVIHPLGSLRLVGVSDASVGRDHPERIAWRPEEDVLPTLMLTHNPVLAEHAHFRGDSAPRVDLMLAGHTHGGQIALPVVGAPLLPRGVPEKYVGGLVEGPAFRGVVSRGVGMTFLPVRFGVPPEVGVIELVRS